MGLFSKAPPPPPPSSSRPDLAGLLAGYPAKEMRSVARAAPEIEYLDQILPPEETIVALVGAYAYHANVATDGGVIVLTQSRVIAVLGSHDKQGPGSGSRREFHPPAPTDPGVTVSGHRALVILITRRCGPISSA